MNIIQVEETQINHLPSFIALGNFDGLHKGHIALIHKVVKAAKKYGVKSSVLIFNQHTKNVIFGGKQILLTSKNQKYELLEKLGIEIIYEMDFTLGVMEMKPYDFFHHLLIEKLNIKGIVVGYDYRFGYRASGNISLLSTYTKDAGLLFEMVEPVMEGKETISSTLIRQLIKEGNIEKANSFLGHPFTIRGNVVHGKKLGSKMGYPTANISLEDHYVIPKFGVYDTDVKVDNMIYPGATSVGTNPTLQEVGIKIETHILQFNQMIYGKTIDIIFRRFIREEIIFESIDDLFLQIKKDKQIVENR